MKFKKNIIEIMKGAVVHCGTQEKAEALLKELAWHGVKWRHGEDLLFPDCQWEVNGIETCYTLIAPHGRSGLIFVCLKFCKVNGYKIIEFEELLEAEDRQENDNDNCDNLIDEMEKITDDLKASAELHLLDVLHDAEKYKKGYVKACDDCFEKIKDMLEELKDN